MTRDADLVSIAADARAEGRLDDAKRIAREAIRIPDEGKHCAVVASVSGGKDSTALILALREAEIPAHYAFADTGWEAKETYEYLDLLEQKLGIFIMRVNATPKAVTPVLEGGDGGERLNDQGRWSAMIDRVRVRAGFPGRMQRFCTRELKLEPLRQYHDHIEESTGKETINAMGVRAQESDRRAQMPEWSDEGPKFTRERWGGFVWRPLINWTVEDVLLIHHRHGIPVNPLYQRGHDRVGCYPCIFSNKEEIRLIAEHAPERIDLIERLEHEMRELRMARNAAEPGRYAHPEDASFFQTQRQGFSGIRKVVEWAQTDYGGKQMQLFSSAPRGGCMKWGLCDLPAGDETGTIPPPPPVKRYFTADFDCVTFSIVTDDPSKIFDMIKQWFLNTGETEQAFNELRASVGDPCFIELTEAEAATKMGFDDLRGGGSFPLNTFELGALLSSEY